MADRVKLQPGDYVSTDGMDEDTYHKVAEAFMAAGACKGEYPREGVNVGQEFVGWENGFHEEYGIFHGGLADGRWGNRHLTVAQVLGTDETPADPIQTLKQRRKERDDAEAAYQDALKAVREELGDGFTLDDNAAPVRDLPPDEWREGDLLECVMRGPYVTEGNIYKVAFDPHNLSDKAVDSSGGVWIEEDDMGDRFCNPSNCFRFHSRPA